jgi:hypothetical protein
LIAAGNVGHRLRQCGARCVIEGDFQAPNWLDLQRGRMHWQKASGYNRGSKVEASIGRYKRVIGDALKSRADDRRKAEVAIAAKALNRMRELGQAQFIRLA